MLIIDNYDSFTYNLKHYVEGLGASVDVIRNDKLDLEEIKKYDKLIFSPGPGLPSTSTNMMAVFDKYHKTKPILGICLGMQGMAEFFGGKLLNQFKVTHGIQTQISVVHPSCLFTDVPDHFQGGLYHSWKVDIDSLPTCLELVAVSKSHVAMALQHKTLPIYGVQFHPESIMTEHGKTMIANFLTI